MELQARKSRSYPSAPELRVSSSISVILNFLLAGSEVMVSSGVQNEGEMTLRPIVKYDDVLPRGRKDIRKIIGFQHGRVTERRFPSLMSVYSEFLWRAPPINRSFRFLFTSSFVQVLLCEGIYHDVLMSNPRGQHNLLP